jgi:hypothetical protein
MAGLIFSAAKRKALELRTNTYPQTVLMGASRPLALKGESKEVNMATAHPTSLNDVHEVHILSVARLAIAGGFTAAAVFALCWVGAFVPFSSPTHAYIGLFTNADIGSGVALFQGTCWSFLFGIIVGAIFALIYNATASFSRR